MPSTPLARGAAPLAILAGTVLVATRIATLILIPADLASLQAAVTGPLYASYAIAQIVAFGLLAVVLVALYELHVARGGPLGPISLIAGLLGTTFMAGDWWYEAFAVPWLADVAPGAFQTGASGPLLAGGLASFVAFGVGWTLVGFACLRGSVIPRWASLLILVGGLTSGVPIAGAYLYGNAVLAIGFIGAGAWLTRQRPAASVPVGAPMPRPAV